MRPDHQMPWGLTETRMPANGLRECVLRVRWMNVNQVRSYADAASTGLLNRVARWRLQQPERFHELHALVSGGR